MFVPVAWCPISGVWLCWDVFGVRFVDLSVG